MKKWKAPKEGTITEVFRVTKVCTGTKGVISSLYVNEDWISKEQCIKLAQQGLVDLEVCTSLLGNTFLRTPPSTSFQENLDSIIDKKYKEKT